MDAFERRFQKEEKEAIKKGLIQDNDVFQTARIKRIMMENLVQNEELDFLVKYFNRLFLYSFNANDIAFEYLKKHFEELREKDRKKIILQIIRKINKSFFTDADELLAEFFERSLGEKGLTVFDLRELNSGGFSTVYEAGDTLIKIADERACQEIVDNSRILYPSFKGLIGDKFIEITRKIDAKRDASDEEIFKIYSELRDQGVIWFDPKKENIGRLSQDDLDYQRINCELKYQNGIIKNKKASVKKFQSGDSVIIDLDHIVFEDDTDRINYIIGHLSCFLFEKVKVLEEDYNKEFQRTNKKSCLPW